MYYAIGFSVRSAGEGWTKTRSRIGQRKSGRIKKKKRHRFATEEEFKYKIVEFIDKEGGGTGVL